MKNFALRNTCEVSINRKDETPVIIFENLSTEQVSANENGISIKLNVGDDVMEEIRDTIELANGSRITCIPTSDTVRGNRSKIIGLYDDKMTNQEKKDFIKYLRTHPEYYAEMVIGVKLPLYQRIFIKLLYKIKK